MANVGEISVTLTSDFLKFQEGMDKAQQSISGFTNSLMSAGAILSAAVTAPMTMAAKAGINFNSSMENASASFTTMLGSAEKAQGLLSDIKEFAEKTPFEMTGLNESAKMMMAFGIESENIMGNLKMLGDIAMGDADKLRGLSYSFSQISSLGRLTGQDLLQMINAGFNPLQIIAEQTGAEMKDLKKAMEEGAIGADMVTAAMEIATSEGGRFFNSMEKASTTFSGRMSTLMDTINSFLGDVTMPLFNEIKDNILPKLIDFVTKVAEAFNKLSPSAKKIITIFGLVVAALGPALVAIGTIGKLANVALSGLSMIASPAGIAVAAVLALVGAIVYLYVTNEEARARIEIAWDKLVETAKRVWGIIVGFCNFYLDIIKDIISWGGVLWENMKNVWDFIKGAIEGATTSLKIFFGWISALLSPLKTFKSAAADAFGAVPGAETGEGINPFKTKAGVWGIDQKVGGVGSESAPIASGRTAGGRVGTAVEKSGDDLGFVESVVQSAADAIKKLQDAFKDMGATGTEALDALTSATNSFINAIRQQTEALADFGSMFNKVMIERMSPEKIMRRLQKTFTEMKKWSDNLQKLQERGMSESILNSLRGMGLGGAGIVAGLAKMSGTQLDKALEYMQATRGIGGQQAYESVKFEHSGKIEVYGINSAGQLVDSGLLDMLAAEIKNGANRYTELPGPSKLLK